MDLLTCEEYNKTVKMYDMSKVETETVNNPLFIDKIYLCDGDLLMRTNNKLSQEKHMIWSFRTVRTSYDKVLFSMISHDLFYQ